MINRRLYKYDTIQLGEPLNETDSLGHGIQVPATFYLQLFNN